jgi:N-acyl-D-amino-acid deacylase
MALDLIIKNGTVYDGTGAAGTRADVGIRGDRVVAVGAIDERAERTIDAEGKLVTPGFVDIHTHLDAQLAWDPIGSSSCWHGVTSVVLGNCGVTFAPCKPADREYLAEMMESVEDIPKRSIMDGLPWDWETYGEYLASLERMPKGINAGGMVGHCAVRYAAMGTRSLDEAPAKPDDVARICAHVDEAIAAGALGFSTSRTFLHRVPDGRPVPGTYADATELYAIGDVLGRRRAGVFEAAARLGERDSENLPNTRAEVAMLGEISRRSGRPVTFGLAHSYRRPTLFRSVMDFSADENARGAHLRPQTTARGAGICFSVSGRTPFDGAPIWRALQDLPLASRLEALRARRAEFLAAAEAVNVGMDWRYVYVLSQAPPRYDCKPEDSLAGWATRRGVSACAAFIDVSLETDGLAFLYYPILNQDMAAIEQMLVDPMIVMGLADAGAHVGQIIDASQPTLFLSYWVREKGLLTIEDAIRRMTSDTAELFGIVDRGVLRPGAYADVNVIDFDALALPLPEFVHDFPHGAGRLIQRGYGIETTIVNGQVFMQDGVHQGALAGRVLRSSAAG